MEITFFSDGQQRKYNQTLAGLENRQFISTKGFIYINIVIVYSHFRMLYPEVIMIHNCQNEFFMRYSKNIFYSLI